MSADSKAKLFLVKYILPKLKFGIGSLISTGLDYTVFFSLLWIDSGLKIAFVQGIAQSIGMLSNFLIQRNFIFEKERGLFASMGWSVSFSLIAITLSSAAIHWLYLIPFFQEYPLIMKLLVTGLFFFFNYYTKQFSFEKKVSL